MRYNPLENPEIRERAIKNSIKTQKEKRLGVFDPKVRRKGIETHRKNKTGFFDKKT